ncbi:MAG: undecaprenyl-phosphate glucose phosphotransferase, partial [Gemmataceae bacterium]
MMIHRSSEPLRACFVIGDTLVTLAAWLLADWLRLRSGWMPILADDVPDFSLCIGQLPLVLVMALVAFRTTQMYNVTRLRRFREEILAVARGVVWLTLAVVAITFATQSPYRSRLMLALFAGMTFLGVLLTRRLSWSLLGRLRARGFNQSHALIIGTGRLARRTARSLQDSTWLGIRTVAYVDDHSTGIIADYPVLASLDRLPELVLEHHIEHVFIALPMNRYADVRRVFDLLSNSIVEVRLMADVPALSGLSLTTSHLQGMTVIGLRENGHYGLNVVIKRLMDVVFSFLGLIVLSPLLGAIAAAIKLTSPGPVFYRQERCSLNGATFRMLKFRTMRVDAEATGPQMTKPNDDRRTRLGTFLRETNLDELPQLFNVLWGDMSLVGPRPERPVFVEEFRETIPNYMARHAVKCGITGWAQVNGWRGNTSLRKRV